MAVAVALQRTRSSAATFSVNAAVPLVAVSRMVMVVFGVPPVPSWATPFFSSTNVRLLPLAAAPGAVCSAMR